MPAAFTAKLSVQVSNFEDIGLLIQLDCLICDFCSSSQRFACGFLQIPPHDGHPCRPANDSPCRARRRLSLLSKSALPGAPKKKTPRAESLAFSFSIDEVDYWLAERFSDLRGATYTPAALEPTKSTVGAR